MLVGTTSIENSELLSGLLKKENLPHQVLNAKQHAKEAEIVAQAGRPKMITIATNMAGRGTDIVLGGNVEKQVQFVEANPEIPDGEKAARVKTLRDEWQSLHDHVVGAGGLKIIGSERHESRRIDNQLRGRSGRQGDPGASRFYLSMEDSLLRIFAGDRMKAIMDRLKLPEGEAIEAGMVTRSIESAQRKVEARNFDIRKQLLEYDDVSNDQRREIYRLRNDILETDDTAQMVTNLRHGFFTDMFRSFVPADSVEEQWDLAGAREGARRRLAAARAVEGDAGPGGHDERRGTARAGPEAADDAYEAKISMWVATVLELRAFDHAPDARPVVARAPDGARRPAAGHPPARVRAEAAEAGVQARGLRAVRRFARSRARRHRQGPDERPGPDAGGIQQAEQQIEAESERRAELARAQHAEFSALARDESADRGDADAGRGRTAKRQPFKRYGDKIGRNDPCPCGSGKKYKQCHGKLASSLRLAGRARLRTQEGAEPPPGPPPAPSLVNEVKVGSLR